MKIFFGAAIQGVQRRGERARLCQSLLMLLRDLGHEVYTEHTGTETSEQTLAALEARFGKLPTDDFARRKVVRDKMIEGVEGDIDGAVFEVSCPSLGTGVEIAHAYLRPRMGLKAIPILLLYEKDFWPHGLSTMIRGLTGPGFDNITLAEFSDENEAKQALRKFLFQ